MIGPDEGAGSDLLGRVLDLRPPPFALLYRPETTGSAMLDVVVGEMLTLDTLAAIPMSADTTHPGRLRHDVLAVVPYRQIAERGFSCVDDGSPLLAMKITEQATVPMAEVLTRIPDIPTELVGEHFDVSDEVYAETVRQVVTDEIGTGAGANFVIKRSYVADIGDYTPRRALALFRRLLLMESGAYWAFIVHTGTRTFVGATPERHISLRNGVVVMNPISGTFRYPASGPALRDVMDFLADRKEADELYMVVDEELKMMARICDMGGRVMGPYLKEMARLAHTEYLIEGHSRRDPRDILRETMFAPTVTGSPLENACRVIGRHEPNGRGYYGGLVALIGRDERGGHSLDSSILIRTADIDSAGRMRIGVGATLVRHSDPTAEVAETRAKAAGLIAALQAGGTVRFRDHPDVRAALIQRNATVAGFWLTEPRERIRPNPVLAGRTVLVVDAEDAFTAMIGHQLRSTGLSVTVRRYDEPSDLTGHDLVVLGPGPGDPHEATDPRIGGLRSALETLLAEQHPFLAVCLSHQVLSMRLGLEVVRRDVPDQGVQREIDLFGARERVGFYNTFAARSDADKIDCPGVGVVQISRDPHTSEVHALLGPHFAALQFHPESVLTHDGVRLLSDLLTQILNRSARGRP